MKLLGWMHRKFKQNSGEPLKDFVIGQPPSDDQQYFPRTSISKPFKHAQKDLNLRKSVSGTGLDAARLDQVYEDESLISISEIFPGFLAIGTLGSSDPATPKFSISIDHITERETEVTENELKQINDELEKVLEAEAKDDGGSRRNSHVSMGRSSHGSTVTLCGKVLEGPESNVVNGGAVVCPLQGYLFGSAVELSETTAVAKKDRTSLGELFQRSKLSEEVEGRCEKDDQKQVDQKEGDKYGMQLIKKKLKKRMLSAASRSSSSSTASGGILDVSNETKLHKILHLFNRKVYPESTAMGKEKWDHKAQKNDKKKKTTIDGVNKNTMNNGSDRTSTDEDIMIFPKNLILKQTLQHYNTQSIPPQFSDITDDADSNWNKEQWIKTDADYLVLEL